MPIFKMKLPDPVSRLGSFGWGLWVCGLVWVSVSGWWLGAGGVWCVGSGS